ncbi:hypothetical protein [Lewinella sp. IMCC34191]|uniref:hypothetical protein n=1 Tax=Lewinella sp. IMCC34191 TaxID=2259172 RepID=UPI0013003A1D|nr:hypothetical protein [Lewinella sp. IMCC34191]
MSIFLQSNGYMDDLWWIIGALIVLVVVFYMTRRAQYTQRAETVKNADPRQNVVNDSSYNDKQDGIDGHRSEGFTAEQAERTVDDMEENGHIPSDEEFHDLRDDMKKD